VLLLAAVLHSAEKDKKRPFSIANLQILDSEDGYPIPPSSQFYPGERVYLRFNVAGYHVDEDYRMKVSYRLDFIGASGAPFSISESGEINEEIYPQDEKWMPIVRSSPMLPQHAESGTYMVKLAIRDELSGQSAASEIALSVEGKDVVGAKDLAIRNFAFSRAEGGEALAAPAFRPGDTLWGSFFITGFRLGQDNAFDIASELKVVSTDGEVLYAFTPQGEKGSPFYPRRWVPAKFHVDLEPNIPRGNYFVQLFVHDRIGGSHFQAEKTFQVR
jgi:hypothetical protein